MATSEIAAIRKLAKDMRAETDLLNKKVAILDPKGIPGKLSGDIRPRP